MLVGMIGISVVVGLAAVIMGTMVGLPLWALIAIYPVAGALTLLLVAAIWSIREDRLNFSHQAATQAPH